MPNSERCVRGLTLKIIQFLRNEAHRFGIRLHRNKRSKNAIQSELEQIPKVGKQTITSLLRQFKSAKRVKTASFEELQKLLGPGRAKKIYSYFNPSVTLSQWEITDHKS